MKKISLFAILFIAMLTSYACSKDDVIEKEKPTLENTIWQEYDSGIMTTILFDKETCIYKMSSPLYHVEDVFTYTYNHPTVILTPKEEGIPSYTCTIKGDVMTVKFTFNGVTVDTLTKK